VADRSQNWAAAWARCGACTPTVAPPVSRKWASRSPRHPPVCSLPPFTPRSGRVHRGETPRHHRRRALPRGCASSPSRCSHPNPVHSSARDSTTSSIPYLSQLRGGKGHIAISATTVPHRRSSVRQLTVASTAPCTSAFPSACSFFPITRRCSSDDATANAGQAGPEHGRAPPRHGCRWGALAAKLHRLPLASSSSTVRFALAPGSSCASYPAV
jgi:hypothetical protein